MINKSHHFARAKVWALAAGSAASLLMATTPAHANAITFGPSSTVFGSSTFADAAYNPSSSFAISGNQFTLTLENFAIGEFNSATLNFSLQISSASELILSNSYAITGTFANGGMATGFITLTPSAGPATTDLLALPPDAMGMQTVFGSHMATLDLMLTLDTNSLTDPNLTSTFAQISTLQFTIGTNAVAAVPESGTSLLLLGLGLAGLFAAQKMFSKSRLHPRVDSLAAGTRATALSLAGALVAAGCFLLCAPGASAQAQVNKAAISQGIASSKTDMARIATIYRKWTEQGATARVQGSKLVFSRSTNNPATGDDNGDDDENNDPDAVVPYPGGQAEYSIAVDSTGQHVVLCYNDTRGFSLTRVSVSGYYYSDNGGATFSDGGQLPTGTSASPVLPQVFGDTDVKYAGGNNFVISSIFVNANNKQTLCIHRSNDFGHTFTGPFEVTAATSPVSANDASDKEFIDIDPITGRMIIAWTNFLAAGGAENRTSYSDDILTGNPPTFAPGVIVVSKTFDGGFPQGIQPRFSGTGQAYIVTNARNKAPNAAVDPSGYTVNNEVFAASLDNGMTWSAPNDIAPADFKNIDSILGNDRVHSFPFMAVDQTVGPRTGYIYLVYAANATNDGGDIAFQRSTDGGATFSAPVLLNARPGNDRAQWFPTLSVDKNTGRVYVTYLDQGIAASGDLTEVSVVYSDDGGATFSRQQPLTTQPFKAGWGNDTGQPNLGDYNMTVGQGGELFSVHAITELKPYGDGQNTAFPGSFTTPDAFFRRTNLPARPPLRMTMNAFPTSGGLGALSFAESGNSGVIDAGDQVKITVPLQNFVTNSAAAPLTVTGISATLSSTTTGISFQRATSAYPNIAPGATKNNSAQFVMRVAPNFVSGTPIELTLAVTSAQGTAAFTYTQPTGDPNGNAVLLSESFDSAMPGSLPAGWTASHGGGANIVPWTTVTGVFGDATNAAFHQNANDGVNGTGNPTRFERLFSPVISVPNDATYVMIDMDVAYNTEDQPGYDVLAYDGFLLRITDVTSGRTLRSVVLEAFEEEFTTGGLQHYPKELPRNSSPSYLQDLSCWAGFSNGIKHVRAKLPATELSSDPATSLAGASIQLRFEYTQDSGGTAFDVRPQDMSDPARATAGVAFDNLVVRAITTAPNELATLSLVPVTGHPRTYTGTITSQAPAPSGGITATLASSAPAQTTEPSSAIIAAGQTVSPPFTVKLSSAAHGTSVIITATGPTNSRSSTVLTRP